MSENNWSNFKGVVIFVLVICAIAGFVMGRTVVIILSALIILLICFPKIKEAVSTKEVSQEIMDYPMDLDLTELKEVFHSMKDFIGRISKNNDIRDFVRKHIKGNIQVDGNIIKDPGMRIKLFLDLDVIYCFMKMGIGSSDLIGAEILDAYKDICAFKIATRDSMSDYYFSQLYVSRYDNPDTLYLGHCLSRVDMDCYHEYCSLLLSFSKKLADMYSEEYLTGAVEWLAELKEECQGYEDEEYEEDVEDDTAEDDYGDGTTSPVTDAMAELDSLIGLDSVKSQIRTLRNFVQVMHRREEKGLKATPVSYHCVFTGNPGTGKTTVARIVAQIYREVGLLKKGHLVETDRSGLVAEYIGQTAVKTNKIIDKALDGVLFIDEAYALFVKDSPMDYGIEAISTLLKRMEDDRDRLVVILAGYTQEMKYFIEANPGLKSRFNRYIEFPDYEVEDLCRIFLANVLKYEYHLTPEAGQIAFERFADAVARKDRHFGNGRFVRNVFEKIIECQADRLSVNNNPDIYALTEILPSDVTEAFAEIGKKNI